MRGAEQSRPGETEVRRTSAGIPIIPALDGFRACALLGVVVFHLIGASTAIGAGEHTASTLAWGAFGNVIDAFFILSGFGLFLGVAARDGRLGSLRDYAVNRATRLLPAYWLALCVVLLLLAIEPAPIGLGATASLPTFGEILVNFGALQMPIRMLDAGFQAGFGVDGPLWMISVIVGFYVVFPLLARPYYRHPILGLVVAGAITVAWREAADHLGLFASIEGGSIPREVMPLIVTDQLPGWAFSFALGMTAAWGYVRLERSPPKTDIRAWATAAAAVGLISCLACAVVYGELAADASGDRGGLIARSHSWLFVAYASAHAVLMGGIALGPRWLQRPFANRLTSRLAELSYPVYLIHVPIVIYVGVLLLELPHGTWADFALWSAVVLPLSLLYAAFSVRFVERPARRWARSRSRAHPTVGRPAGATATSAR